MGQCDAAAFAGVGGCFLLRHGGGVVVVVVDVDGSWLCERGDGGSVQL